MCGTFVLTLMGEITIHPPQKKVSVRGTVLKLSQEGKKSWIFFCVESNYGFIFFVRMKKIYTSLENVDMI